MYDQSIFDLQRAFMAHDFEADPEPLLLGSYTQLEAIRRLTEHAPALRLFAISDGVHWSEGSDVVAGTVVDISKSGASIYVTKDKTRLLNPADSGAPGALRCDPGGFAGHTSGEQRWIFLPDPEGERLVFTRRAAGYFKLKGTSTSGSMRAWGLLRKGRLKHYDFNF